MAPTGTYQRTLVGIVVTLTLLGALLAVLLPFRDSLSSAIPALVFVIPAVVGVVIAGFWVGVVGAAAGFLAYDWFFLPPYDTLTVRSAQNWVALVVYMFVVLIVAQVVAQLRAAREEALRRREEADRLYELSQALIGDLPLPQLLTHIVDSVQGAFQPRWTAVVLPEGGGDSVGGQALEVAATSGQPLIEADVASLTSAQGQTLAIGLVGDPGDQGPRKISVALAVDGRAVGMLVLQDVVLMEADRNLLGTFTNQAALAVDRARLREQVLRARLLEEIDRWRGALMGAVSHDLRTPLAAVKTAVSSLRQPGSHLSEHDRSELLELIEQQSDRLARLVTNVLDMTRIEAGALEIRPTTMPFEELVDEAIGNLGGIVGRERVRVDAPAGLPMLRIDHVLVSQVLANLLDNAERVSPPASVITVSAQVSPRGDERIEISVTDQGPGIAPAERARVFEMFSQNGRGGRAGLGLAIAKAFVEAHGGLIWIDPGVDQGARVIFTVPREPAVATHA